MEQDIEGVCNGGEVLNELLIEIAEAKEGLNVLDILWWSHILKFGYVVGVRGYSVTGDGIPKVSQGGSDPLALARLDLEICLPNLSEDLLEVVDMFFQCSGKDDNIVKVNVDELFIEFIQNVIHKVLEGSQGIFNIK